MTYDELLAELGRLRADDPHPAGFLAIYRTAKEALHAPNSQEENGAPSRPLRADQETI